MKHYKVIMGYEFTSWEFINWEIVMTVQHNNKLCRYFGDNAIAVVS